MNTAPQPGDQVTSEGPVMPKWAAAIITVLSFPMGPGIVVVLLPWLITRWHHGALYPVGVRALGVALIAVASLVMIAAFARFPAEGGGTPFPTNPPSSDRVIVGGPYRYVRNPMYVAFVVAIIGLWLLLARPVLLIYAGAFFVAIAAFVQWYEEPTMRKRFGQQYVEYCSRVHRWLPRA
jgi:protein-S-isoprenylcysteine O-methyltransferase Ste14